MALSVIGAGYGRTGTLSLKAALEQLGYLKCHHMIEVLQSPAQIEGWMAAARGERVNWDELFAGYLASVDWPSCHFYRELADYYPQAKVVLTVRDPHAWYESMNATTLRVIRRSMAEHPDRPSLGTELVVKGAFGGNIDSAAHAVEIFEAHTAEVMANIPSERLLVFDVREGWEPLCNFLQRDVPAAAFPRVNSREEFDGIFFGNRAD
ncbi:MAG TPA: sulfotransferase [Pseudomonadales bacterium]